MRISIGYSAKTWPGASPKNSHPRTQAAGATLADFSPGSSCTFLHMEEHQGEESVVGYSTKMRAGASPKIIPPQT